MQAYATPTDARTPSGTYYHERLIFVGMKIFSHKFLHTVDEPYYGADAKQFVSE